MSLSGSNQHLKYALTGVIEPHPHDVLSGRGSRYSSHPGNIYLRYLVANMKETYILKSSKRGKTRIAQDLVDRIRAREPPGRFLAQDENDGKWYNVGNQKARQKLSQCLREGSSKIKAKAQTYQKKKSSQLISSDLIFLEKDSRLKNATAQLKKKIRSTKLHKKNIDFELPTSCRNSKTGGLEIFARPREFISSMRQKHITLDALMECYNEKKGSSEFKLNNLISIGATSVAKYTEKITKDPSIVDENVNGNIIQKVPNKQPPLPSQTWKEKSGVGNVVHAQAIYPYETFADPSSSFYHLSKISLSGDTCNEHKMTQSEIKNTFKPMHPIMASTKSYSTSNKHEKNKITYDDLNKITMIQNRDLEDTMIALTREKASSKIEKVQSNENWSKQYAKAYQNQLNDSFETSASEKIFNLEHCMDDGSFTEYNFDTSDISASSPSTSFSFDESPISSCLLAEEIKCESSLEGKSWTTGICDNLNYPGEEKWPTTSTNNYDQSSTLDFPAKQVKKNLYIENPSEIILV